MERNIGNVVLETVQTKPVEAVKPIAQAVQGSLMVDDGASYCQYGGSETIGQVHPSDHLIGKTYMYAGLSQIK